MMIWCRKMISFPYSCRRWKDWKTSHFSQIWDSLLHRFGDPSSLPQNHVGKLEVDFEHLNLMPFWIVIIFLSFLIGFFINIPLLSVGFCPSIVNGHKLPFTPAEKRVDTKPSLGWDTWHSPETTNSECRPKPRATSYLFAFFLFCFYACHTMPFLYVTHYSHLKHFKHTDYVKSFFSHFHTW